MGGWLLAWWVGGLVGGRVGKTVVSLLLLLLLVLLIRLLLLLMVLAIHMEVKHNKRSNANLSCANRKRSKRYISNIITENMVIDNEGFEARWSTRPLVFNASSAGGLARATRDAAARDECGARRARRPGGECGRRAQTARARRAAWCVRAA